MNKEIIDNPLANTTTNAKGKTFAVSAVAMLVTGGLFYTMSGLIADDSIRLSSPGKTIYFRDILFTPKEVPPKRNEIKVEEPPKLIDPPETTEEIRRTNTTGQPSIIPIPPGTPPLPDRGDQLSFGLTDGDMTILAGFPPQYPHRANERGIEGYVMISLTVNTTGQVEDPYVLSAEPEGIFNNAAIKAISKFKYKPRVVNGYATPVYNVRYKMIFELED